MNAKVKPASQLRYLLFNKPYGVLCQFTDESGRSCLKDFVNIPDIYACGRLDWDSEGLLLLTNDGPLINALASPSAKLPKTYLVQVEGLPTASALKQLRQGVMFEGKKTLPAKVEHYPEGLTLPPRTVPIRVRKNIPDSWIKLTLVEGRNRQVRKMTAKVGFPTLRLIRYSIGPFNLDKLESGKWRELSSSEVYQQVSTFITRTAKSSLEKHL